MWAPLHVDFGVAVDPVEHADAAGRHRGGQPDPYLSVGYMRGDRGYARFFACLSLFTFSMLGMVLSEQFPANVHFLGIGRRLQLFVDRFLV